MNLTYCHLQLALNITLQYIKVKLLLDFVQEKQYPYMVCETVLLHKYCNKQGYLQMNRSV